MSRNDKTSANLVAIMTIEGVAPAGFQLSQFSTDAGIVAEQVAEVQTDMTLDGHLTVGYTPQPQVVSITLMPTSPALPYLRQLQQAQRTLKKPLQIGLTVTFPSTGRSYSFTNGYLTNGQVMPPANRVQDPVTLQVTFEGVN